MTGITIFGAFPLPGAPNLGFPMKGIHEFGSTTPALSCWHCT